MLQIRSYSDAVIEFTFTDSNGDPAEVDGVLTVSVDPESTGLVDVVTQPDESNPTQATVRTFEAQATEVKLNVTGDVDLGEGVISRTWVCSLYVYDEAQSMQCSVISSEPTPD